MICKEKEQFLSKIHQSNKYIILGLDVGDSKIGTSLYNSELSFAIPHKTIQRSNTKQDLEKLNQMIQEQSISGIVIGMPYELSGIKGKSAEKIEKFAIELSENTNLPISFQDERFTTAFANTLLKSTNMKRKQRNKVDDQIAACIILNNFFGVA